MSFEDGVAARLDALSASAAQATRLLAVARQPIARTLLLRSRAMRTRLTPTALAEAVMSGLVAERDDRIAVVHDRYADAIYQATLPWDREAFHGELAAVMADRPARAAWHLDRTGDRAAARAARERAAIEARRLDRRDDPGPSHPSPGAGHRRDRTTDGRRRWVRARFPAAGGRTRGECERRVPTWCGLPPDRHRPVGGRGTRDQPRGTPRGERRPPRGAWPSAPGER